MVAILIVAAGVFSLVLGVQKVSYGLEALSFDGRLASITYKSPTSSKELLTEVNRASYNNTVNEILTLLDKAGNTNKLSQLFQSGGKEAITNNNTNYTTVRNFESSNQNYIKLSFRKSNPLFGLKGDNNSNYELVPANQITERNRTVWIMFISLDDIKNKFQKHNWLLVRYDPMENAESTLSITQKYTTYGNYHKLAEYVKELRVV